MDDSIHPSHPLPSSPGSDAEETPPPPSMSTVSSLQSAWTSKPNPFHIFPMSVSSSSNSLKATPEKYDDQVDDLNEIDMTPIKPKLASPVRQEPASPPRAEQALVLAVENSSPAKVAQEITLGMRVDQAILKEEDDPLAPEGVIVTRSVTVTEEQIATVPAPVSEPNQTDSQLETLSPPSAGSLSISEQSSILQQDSETSATPTPVPTLSSPATLAEAIFNAPSSPISKPQGPKPMSPERRAIAAKFDAITMPPPLTSTSPRRREASGDEHSPTRRTTSRESSKPPSSPNLSPEDWAKEARKAATFGKRSPERRAESPLKSVFQASAARRARWDSSSSPTKFEDLLDLSMVDLMEDDSSFLAAVGNITLDDSIDHVAIPSRREKTSSNLKPLASPQPSKLPSKNALGLGLATSKSNDDSTIELDLRAGRNVSHSNIFDESSLMLSKNVSFDSDSDSGDAQPIKPKTDQAFVSTPHRKASLASSASSTGTVIEKPAAMSKPRASVLATPRTSAAAALTKTIPTTTPMASRRKSLASTSRAPISGTSWRDTFMTQGMSRRPPSPQATPKAAVAPRKSLAAGATSRKLVALSTTPRPATTTTTTTSAASRRSLAPSATGAALRRSLAPAATPRTSLALAAAPRRSLASSTSPRKPPISTTAAPSKSIASTTTPRRLLALTTTMATRRASLLATSDATPVSAVARTVRASRASLAPTTRAPPISGIVRSSNQRAIARPSTVNGLPSSGIRAPTTRPASISSTGPHISSRPSLSARPSVTSRIAPPSASRLAPFKPVQPTTCTASSQGDGKALGVSRLRPLSTTLPRRSSFDHPSLP